MFEPRGIFEATRRKEYDSYCQGIEDVLDVLDDTGMLSLSLRDKLFELVAEAADDFTD